MCSQTSSPTAAPDWPELLQELTAAAEGLLTAANALSKLKLQAFTQQVSEKELIMSCEIGLEQDSDAPRSYRANHSLHSRVSAYFFL